MSLEQPLLEATSRPDELVGRQKEMATLEAAIYEPGRECRIVLIGGRGGFGKTRLLEEIQRRMGHKGASQQYGPPDKLQNNWLERYGERALVSDVLDVTDVRLHTRDTFLKTLGNRRTWEDKIRFMRHELAQNKRRQLAQAGMALRRVMEVSREAEGIFWKEFREATEVHRLVILIDTLEQLSNHSSGWLIEHGLLQPEDIIFSTQLWLLEQIKKGKFVNTTLVIAGREDEGATYFKSLRGTIEETFQSDAPCHKFELPARKFTLSETQEYFEALRSNWDERSGNLAEDIRQTVQYWLDNPEQIRRIHYYSGGQPIRLALYMDILIQGETIPEPLMPIDNEIPNGDTAEEIVVSGSLQQEIEAVFIDLLFSRDSLRSQILRHLVRATRGLTARQLHFILDSADNNEAVTWQDDPERVAVIQKELDEMRHLAIIKPKPLGRVGLQDEVYRIYATQMNHPERRENEAKDRLRLYRQILAWLKPQREKKQQERTKRIEHRLTRINVERLQKALSTSLPSQTELEKQELSDLVTEIRDLDLEFLHYSLLLDPYEHFNDTYYTFIDKKNKTQDEQAQTMIRTEMWRTLNDQYLTPFMDLTKPYNKQNEDALTVLRRAAQQNDAAEWILRFVTRGQHDRAIQLADDIEATIKSLSNPEDQASWSHTFAYGERTCWREYAHIYKGKQIDNAIERLHSVVANLNKLAEADINKLVFPEKLEYGFRGHLAFPRLIYVLGVAYNTIGYGLTTYGDFRQAVHYYTLALQYLREFPLSEQTPTTLNNLSRALVEMGRTGAVRICEDGLDLRLKSGELSAIASSYNTLGLIYNDLHRPEEAIHACATALAITREVDEDENERNTGLILVQLGEGLRRIVKQHPYQEEAPDAIFREAERAIEKAREIFTVSGAGREEKFRLVETEIELGCLYRDWMGRTDKEKLPDRWILRRNDALYYLTEAIRGSRELELVRLELDAQVNMAWTHYYAGDWEKAKEALRQAESLLPEKAKLHPQHIPPSTHEHPSYLFHQASKLYGLYGRIAFDQFNEQVQKAKRQFLPEQKRERQLHVHQRTPFQKLLQSAAKAYVQSLTYAQLFTPGSPILAVIYDDLYASLKKFNTIEQEDFYRYAREANQTYRTSDIRLENLGNIESFLGEDFGDYSKLPKSLSTLYGDEMGSE